MFQTHQQAEIKYPPSIFPDNERTWRWVEISLHIPYFYLNVTVEVGEGVTCQRHFLFGHLNDLLNLIANSGDEFIDKEIGLMSPGHMNGCGFYQLAQVNEIWESNSRRKQKFVLSDGSKLYNSIYEDDGNNDTDMVLIYTASST